MTCPDCGTRLDPRCETCGGGPPTLPSPPPGELAVALTPESLEWPEEAPTAEQCPDALRNHHAR